MKRTAAGLAAYSTVMALCFALSKAECTGQNPPQYCTPNQTMSKKDPGESLSIQPEPEDYPQDAGELAALPRPTLERLLAKYEGVDDTMTEAIRDALSKHNDIQD